MILKQALKLLIDKYGIWLVNDAIGEIFNDRMETAINQNDEKQAQYFDELSEFYDETNRFLDTRDYKDKKIQ